MSNDELLSTIIGLPITQVDLDAPICPQFSHIIALAKINHRIIRRIDVSIAIVECFSNELSRMSSSERAINDSMSPIPETWRWRGVPIRCKEALRDDWCACIMESPETETMRGEPGAIIYKGEGVSDK